MKKLILITAVVASATAQADSVRGYMRKDGTYVQGYQRSAPDAYRFNNYGSQSFGGSQRDEFSSRPAYNQGNYGYNYGDNDGDGIANGSDNEPESGSRW